VCRNPQHRSLLAVVSATSAPPFQPLRHQRNAYHPVGNRFTRQTLYTVNRKHFSINGVTDLINELPGKSSVNTAQLATIKEAVFSVDPTDTPIDWLDSDHVIYVYCRSMFVPRLYKKEWQNSFMIVTRKPEDSSKLEEYRRVQEVSLWKFNVWFEEFMCAIVQLYCECVI
jgi:hypothetical protein